ncbi:TEuncharacterized, partial [Mya arenaria]
MSRTFKSEMYAYAVLLILVRVVCAQECSTCKDGADGHSSKCSNTGKCYFGCIDGYYGNNCLHNCTYQNCLSCHQNTGHYCSKCKSGYYLHYTYCHPCNFKCKSCESLQRCLSCYDGYWGETCRNKCSSDCNNGYCDKESGVCRCSPNYKGETCNQCANGRFGKTCQYLCSRDCKNGHCDEESGVCRCNQNYKGETCDQCSNGQFGEKCEHNCSLGCEFGNCTRDTGTCPCKSEWSGQSCKTKIETNVEQHTKRDNFYENKSKLTKKEPENFFALNATVNEGEDRDDISAREITAMVEISEDCNNTKEVGKFKLTVADLPKYVQYICLKDLEEEFQRLPYGLVKPYEVSQTRLNMHKNRYKGIYPYDDTRVVVCGGD